jgi:non-ribosomal peptide synthetase component F
VLAAAALVLGLRAGTESTALRIVTANRFTPELRRMVGTCVQTGLLVVDLTDCSFSAFLERTWAASMRALRHSRYPEPDLRQAVDAVGRERRTTLDLSTFFHNMTEGEPVVETDDGATTREALAEATTRTAVRPGAVFPRWRRFTLEVRDAGDAMELRLEVDPTAMSRQDAETFVRSVEKLVVHAVHDDLPLTAVRALTDLAAVHR